MQKNSNKLLIDPIWKHNWSYCRYHLVIIILFSIKKELFIIVKYLDFIQDESYIDNPRKASKIFKNICTQQL